MVLSNPVTNYCQIYIIPNLSKVFERLIFTRLANLFERAGVFSGTLLVYHKFLGTGDAFLTFSYCLQLALVCACETRIVQLDFSAAFDRVNHKGLSYVLQAASVGSGLFLLCA